MKSIMQLLGRVGSFVWVDLLRIYGVKSGQIAA
jgi:hypothetical protein